MTASEIKALFELMLAGGLPGALALYVLIEWGRSRGKVRDPAADVLDALAGIRSDLKEVRSGVDDMDTRLTRVETRQEMLLGPEVQHWSGRTIPPR